MIGRSHLIVGVATYATIWCHPLGPLRAPRFPGTHDLPELLAGGSPLAWATSLAGLGIALLAVAIGALLPDLDEPDSRLANERVLGVRVLRPFATFMGATFGHRQATHSLLALAAVVVVGEFPLFAQLVAALGAWAGGQLLPLAEPRLGAETIALLGGSWQFLLLVLERLSLLHLGLIFGWGFASHLLADMLTKWGVPLLWPLGWDFGLPPFRSLRISTGTGQEAAYVTALILAAIFNALLTNRGFAALARSLIT